jgi:hypothetical protein
MPEGARQRADQAFHELPVGADMGSIEYTASDQRVERHLRATHQTPYPESGGERLAPVSMLASDGIWLAEPSSTSASRSTPVSCSRFSTPPSSDLGSK